ncbi:hypothetical protein AACH10_09830 [Ideonella sp. DXS22W]|uniref:DUF1090 family protein n=1 Tax=Pseudaquabacterium inlustre TaxID=2984192 RepID=A0ABU9CIZ4_9BURK
MPSWRAGVALLLACLSAAAQAQPVVADDAAERARIERDRQAVVARHAQAERQCAQRFQVTDCLDSARAERRQALDQLRREQAVLDDARRRARAAERLQGQQRRQREREAQALLSSPREAARAASAAPAAGSEPAAGVAGRPGHRPAAAAAASAASASHAAQAAAHARREHRAEQHAIAVRQRNAARDAKKPPAAGLPLPGASGPAAPR